MKSADPTDLSAIEELPQLPTAHVMDEPPPVEEIRKAIDSLKTGKAPDPDGISAEVYRCLDDEALQHLMKIYYDCWRTGTLPKQWLHAVIVTIYKNIGDKFECGNYRGLSLLDVAGKIFAKIIASRFSHHITEKLLPDS